MVRNPFQRSGNHDPKLALLRRADSERDTAYSIGGRTKLAQKKKVSLASVPTLERDESNNPHSRGGTSVTLNHEILTLTDRYAQFHGISRDTAANELLRIALGAAA
jgi:hypothetical protein